MDPQVSRRLLEVEQTRLLQLRRGLEAELSNEPDSDGAAELSVLDQHQADVASELFEREKDLSILARVAVELDDVIDAMARLDHGTYGRCQVCDVAIPEDRLEAVPATRFCMDHEEQREGSQANAASDSAALADDVAAREGARHLEFLPPDDEPEDLELAAEERALHLSGGDGGPLTPDEVESAEERQAEVEDRARAAAEREMSMHRTDADGVALEEDELGADP